MSKLTANQLKSLKHERAGGCPDAAWLSSTRETLLMQVRNTVTEDAPKTGWAAVTATLRFFSGEITRVAVVPVAVLALMLTSHLGAAATVSFAQGSLPGDTLYNVKLMAERVSLVFTSRSVKAERELDIAGRRLDEMVRIAASTDTAKDEKLSRVAALFTSTMSEVRADLVALKSDDGDDAMKVALLVDSRADSYQQRFAQGNLAGRQNLRLALLSLDQASVSALELLVDKSRLASNALPEAQLTSVLGRNIETVASHVAAAPDTPAAIKAGAAVQEARELLTAGDFQAAVRKVVEGANLVSQSADSTVIATSTPETSATSTSLH